MDADEGHQVTGHGRTLATLRMGGLDRPVPGHGHSRVRDVATREEDDMFRRLFSGLLSRRGATTAGGGRPAASGGAATDAAIGRSVRGALDRLLRR